MDFSIVVLYCENIYKSRRETQKLLRSMRVFVCVCVCVLSGVCMCVHRWSRVLACFAQLQLARCDAIADKENVNVLELCTLHADAQVVGACDYGRDVAPN